MLGRCDNDPLDVAEEICGMCGGEFCLGCLVPTKARNAKHACKSCVVNRAGLRPTEKEPLATKRKIRKRRKALAASAADREKNGFTYFNDPDSDFDHGPRYQDETSEDDESTEEANTVESVEPDDGSDERKVLRSANRTNRRKIGRLGGRRKTDAAEPEPEIEPELSAKSLAVWAQNEEVVEEHPRTAPTIENVGPSATEVLDQLREASQAAAEDALVEAANSTPGSDAAQVGLRSPRHLAVAPTLGEPTLAWMAASSTATSDSTPHQAGSKTTTLDPLDLSVSPFGKGVTDEKSGLAEKSQRDKTWIPPALRG